MFLELQFQNHITIVFLSDCFPTQFDLKVVIIVRPHLVGALYQFRISDATSVLFHFVVRRPKSLPFPLEIPCLYSEQLKSISKFTLCGRNQRTKCDKFLCRGSPGIAINAIERNRSFLLKKVRPFIAYFTKWPSYPLLVRRSYMQELPRQLLHLTIQTWQCKNSCVQYYNFIY